MKLARFVLKIAAAVLAVAALACAVIAFWDRIEECAYRVRQRVAARNGCDTDLSDYEDWVD